MMRLSADLYKIPMANVLSIGSINKTCAVESFLAMPLDAIAMLLLTDDPLS